MWIKKSILQLKTKTMFSPNDKCILCIKTTKETIKIFGDRGRDLKIAETLSNHFWFRVNYVRKYMNLFELFELIVRYRLRNIAKTWMEFVTSVGKKLKASINFTNPFKKHIRIFSIEM